MQTPNCESQRARNLTVNGASHPIDADPKRPLLSVLRDDLDLTGTKYGCGEAQCGACVVLVAGKPLPACVTPLGEVEAKAIETIEGLASGERLHPVQQAFIDAGAMQCGFCTPGMIMETVALLRENPNPDENAIVSAMDRHICRCGVYNRVLDAIQAASEKTTQVENV